MPHVVPEVALMNLVVRVLEDSVAFLLYVLMLANVADSVRPLIHTEPFLSVFEPLAMVSAAVGPPLD